MNSAVATSYNKAVKLLPFNLPKKDKHDPFAWNRNPNNVTPKHLYKKKADKFNYHDNRVDLNP